MVWSCWRKDRMITWLNLTERKMKYILIFKRKSTILFKKRKKKVISYQSFCSKRNSSTILMKIINFYLLLMRIKDWTGKIPLIPIYPLLMCLKNLSIFLISRKKHSQRKNISKSKPFGSLSTKINKKIHRGILRRLFTTVLSNLFPKRKR